MKSNRSWIFIGLILLAISCSPNKENQAFENILQKKDHTVLMFFAPDCPLCHTFSKPFNELELEYPSFQFIAVQSGMNYETMEIKMFKEETNLTAPIFIDRDYAVANRFDASITPEFFVVSKDGDVLYHGLLDDRMESLGVYKQNWNTYYVEDALKAISKGKQPEVQSTDAIGCVLEY